MMALPQIFTETPLPCCLSRVKRSIKNPDTHPNKNWKTTQTSGKKKGGIQAAGFEWYPRIIK
jgi:hypothetical protein